MSRAVRPDGCPKENSNEMGVSSLFAPPINRARGFAMDAFAVVTEAEDLSPVDAVVVVAAVVAVSAATGFGAVCVGTPLPAI